MNDIFDVDTLLPEFVIALGLAMLIGNGVAWWKHRHGKPPEDVDDATYRPGRVTFFLVVGLVMTVWGVVSLFG